MNARRMLVLVTMLVLALLAFAGLTSADSNTADGVEVIEAMDSSQVDLKNYGVEWAGGDFNTWYIYVKNVGSAPAGAFWVRIAKPDNTLVKSVKVSGLAAGATTTISVYSTSKCLRIKIDAYNQVPEFNESNNFIYPCNLYK